MKNCKKQIFQVSNDFELLELILKDEEAFDGQDFEIEESLIENLALDMLEKVRQQNPQISVESCCLEFCTFKNVDTLWEQWQSKELRHNFTYHNHELTIVISYLIRSGVSTNDCSQQEEVSKDLIEGQSLIQEESTQNDDSLISSKAMSRLNRLLS